VRRRRISKIPKPRVCHDGYSAPYSDWLKPFQEIPLPKHLAALGCNPASCENPPACKIPDCRVVDVATANHGHMDMRACKLDACSNGGGACCELGKGACSWKRLPKYDKTGSNNETKLCPRGQSFALRFLANRVGTCVQHSYSSGLVYCNPQQISALSTYGAHKSTDVLNPLNLSTCYKISIGPVESAADGVYRSSETLRFKRATYVLTKRVVCMSARGAQVHRTLKGKKASSKTCFAYKTGRCIKFRTDVWPNYISATTGNQIRQAYALFKAGKFDECAQVEMAYAAKQVAGN